MARDHDIETPGILRYETPEPKQQRSWRWLLMILLALIIPWGIMFLAHVVMKLAYSPTTK